MRYTIPALKTLTPPLNVRAASVTDAIAIADIYADYVRSSAVSFEEVAPSAAEMGERIDQITETHPWLVAQCDGAVIGFAYAAPHSIRPGYRWTVDLSIYVDRAAHSLGVGTLLYSALIQNVRDQGFKSAFAEIVLPNRGSVRLHETLGFRLIGVHKSIGFKLGLWRDIAYWQLLLGPTDTAPAEPSRVSRLERPG